MANSESFIENRRKSVIAGSGNTYPPHCFPWMRPTIILEHFMALIKLAKPRKRLPFSWLDTAKAHQRSARTKAPVPWLRKMITETSLLPLNTLITSVKESNN
jgi:hypothetical protein